MAIQIRAKKKPLTKTSIPEATVADLKAAAVWVAEHSGRYEDYYFVDTETGQQFRSEKVRELMKNTAYQNGVAKATEYINSRMQNGLVFDANCYEEGAESTESRKVDGIQSVCR